jgi:hypothetical protein
MLRQTFKYGAILIGAYLALHWATNGGKLITTGAKGAVSVAKALQGRT